MTKTWINLKRFKVTEFLSLLPKSLFRTQETHKKQNKTNKAACLPQCLASLSPPGESCLSLVFILSVCERHPPCVSLLIRTNPELFLLHFRTTETSSLWWNGRDGSALSALARARLSAPELNKRQMERLSRLRTGSMRPPSPFP